MKLSSAGKNIFLVEVENISPTGIWLFVNGQEYFLPHDKYPWFKNAKISEIHNVELVNDYHLYWPDLDIDLELETLEHPDKFPLIYKHP